MSTEPEKRSDEETWARLADSATPGPWTAGGNGIHRKHECVALTHRDPIEQRRADADFIAAARTAVPSLLAALAASRADNERLRDENERMRSAGRVPALLAAETDAAAARVEVSQLRTKLDEAQAKVAAFVGAVDDMHPVYGSTSACHGGIGGSTITEHCAHVCTSPKHDPARERYETARTELWHWQRLAAEPLGSTPEQEQAK